MHPSLDRFLLSIFIMGTFFVVAKAVGAVSRRSVIARGAKGRQLKRLAGGTPTLIYFWTSACALCVPQERQIEKARAALERNGRQLKVRKVNAMEEDELVKAMNVLTVPTTVVLDGRGNVVAWNPGLREAEKLISQFEKAA